MLSFDTSMESADRKLILLDGSLPIGIVTHRRIIYRSNEVAELWIRDDRVPVSQAPIICLECGFHGQGPVLCPGLKAHAKLEVGKHFGLCTSGLMVLLERKIQVQLHDYEEYLNNRAFVTLKYKGCRQIGCALERVKNIATETVQSDDEEDSDEFEDNT